MIPNMGKCQPHDIESYELVAGQEKQDTADHGGLEQLQLCEYGYDVKQGADNRGPHGNVHRVEHQPVNYWLKYPIEQKAITGSHTSSLLCWDTWCPRLSLAPREGRRNIGQLDKLITLATKVI